MFINQALSFLKESSDELKRITWPTRKETTRLTIVVIVVSVVIGLFVGGLDFTFTNLMNSLIQK